MAGQMILRLVVTTLSIAVSVWAEVPSGRWDGTITVGALKVPFTMYFEGSGSALTGSFVNGDSRVSSTSGGFDGETLRLRFEQSGTRLEATLKDGVLKGTYGGAERGVHPFTAAAYCTCAYEGEAGPEIIGGWEIPDAGWRLTLHRKGEDTFATISRRGDDLGPLTGRFNGAFFELKYFDGTRAAVLEIEPRKDGALGLEWKEPGGEVRKFTAVRVASRQ